LEESWSIVEEFPWQELALATSKDGSGTSNAGKRRLKDKEAVDEEKILVILQRFHGGLCCRINSPLQRGFPAVLYFFTFGVQWSNERRDADRCCRC